MCTYVFLSNVDNVRPLEGQERTRIVLRARCKDDDKDGDELEWLARNKRAPTRVWGSHHKGSGVSEHYGIPTP